MNLKRSDVMCLPTFNVNFWLPVTVCLVILFGCADPGTQKKSEEADATATQKIKIGLSMDSLSVKRC